MKLCNPECVPICDFCIHAVCEQWFDDGEPHDGIPTSCAIHDDEAAQSLIKTFGYCPDFHCFMAKRNDKKTNNGLIENETNLHM